MGKFVIRRTETGVVFHLKARNGETVAVSQLYASMEACYKGIESVIRHAALAAVEDQTARGFAPRSTRNSRSTATARAGSAFGCSPETGRTSRRAQAGTKENCRKGIESLRRQCAEIPEIVVQGTEE